MNKIFERYRKLNTGEYTYNNGKQEIKNIAIDWDEIRRLVGEETEKIKPKKGVDYFDGDDGVSIHGKDGFTPIKGVDYFTDEDIESVVSKVYGQIKVPEPQLINVDEIKRQLRSYVKGLLAKLEIEPEYVRDLLEELKGDKRLDANRL